MAHFGVYMYPYNQQASLGNFNMPYSNKRLVLYKGANNPLSFTVHNADGKYLILKDNEYLIFSIFDRRNDTRVFEVVMEKQQASWVSEAGMTRQSLGNKIKVYYGCNVPAGIIADLSPGTKYRWGIHKVTLDGSLIEPTEYLYTGLNFEASSDLEISNSAAPVFTPSDEISQNKDSAWVYVNNGMDKPIARGLIGEWSIMSSSPYAAGVQYGMVDGLSTIALYFKDFIGRVQLQACLSNDVPKDSEEYKWFIVKLPGCSCDDYITNSCGVNNIPEALEGIKAYNFKGNFMWLRVVIAIPTETIEVQPSVVVKRAYPFKTLPKILIRR